MLFTGTAGTPESNSLKTNIWLFLAWAKDISLTFFWLLGARVTVGSCCCCRGGASDAHPARGAREGDPGAAPDPIQGHPKAAEGAAAPAAPAAPGAAAAPTAPAAAPRAATDPKPAERKALSTHPGLSAPPFTGERKVSPSQEPLLPSPA